MSQATSLIHVNPDSLTVHADLDSDNELRVEVQGEVAMQADMRYDRVRIEYTLRNAEGRVVLRDESSVDLDYAVDGRANFNNRIYVKPHLADQPTEVELRASAYVISVDAPIRVPLQRS